MEQEFWRPVVGWEGYYEVSNLGRVKSIARIVRRGNSKLPIGERILRQAIDTHGYYCVVLCDKQNNRRRTTSVHQIVARAFVGNPQNKEYIDHINTIKTDNRVTNLMWVTCKENLNNPITLQRIRMNGHGKEVARKNMETRKKHKKSNAPKEVFQYDIENNFISSYESISEAERVTGIKNIKKVVQGKRITAGGYKWYSKRIEPAQ